MNLKWLVSVFGRYVSTSNDLGPLWSEPYSDHLVCLTWALWTWRTPGSRRPFSLGLFVFWFSGWPWQMWRCSWKMKDGIIRNMECGVFHAAEKRKDFSYILLHVCSFFFFMVRCLRPHQNWNRVERELSPILMSTHNAKKNKQTKRRKTGAEYLFSLFSAFLFHFRRTEFTSLKNNHMWKHP